MNEQWIWFLMGFVPYYLASGQMPGGRRMFEVRALYWRLRIERWVGGPRGWVLQIPLIEQLKDAVWAVVLHLSKHGPKS